MDPFTIAQLRKRLVTFVECLPQATAVPCGEGHLSFEVRRKRFGYFLDNHHGDGRLALNCKAAMGANQALAHSAPELFHIPKHLGHLGWLGLWLDVPDIDWADVQEIIKDAYRLSAPKRLSVSLSFPALSRPLPTAAASKATEESI